MSLFFFHIYFTRCDLGPPKQKSKINPLNTGAGIDGMIRDTQTKNKDKGKVEVNPINDTEGGSKTKHNRQERND